MYACVKIIDPDFPTKMVRMRAKYKFYGNMKM